MATENPPKTSVSEARNLRFERWWKDVGLRKLLAWQACVLVSQMTTGYDESTVSNFQSMQPWVKDMGHPSDARIGLITAIVFVGGFVGAFIASPVADRFGRRIAMFTGGAWSLTGTILQTAAQNSDMFIVGRFFIGVGISFCCVAGPSLLFELSHPSIRGTVTSLFNVLWYVGSIIAAWTSFGTGHMTTTWSWRIPSLIQGVPSAWVMLAVLFGLPESPRWLCAHGRTEEAQKMLAYYHANGEESSELVTREIVEIEATIEADRVAKSSSWSVLYRYVPNRKRLTIVICVALLTLWNGQGVISYYYSPILDSIGITSTTQQTGINGGLQIWNFLSSLAGALLADRMGRRSLWLTSFVSMIFANIPLTISSAMYKKKGSDSAAYVVVIFLFLYDCAFNLANNPLLYCYPTEILPFLIRARGLTVQVAVSQVALTVNQYVNPIALNHIGYYYYIFYLGMLVLGTTIIYFFFPETKGKTEEELAALFEPSGSAVELFGEDVERVQDGKHPDVFTSKKGLE